jgi:hypothetical protein
VEPDPNNYPIPTPAAQKVDDSVYKLIYELGNAMIKDDAGDLYRTTYKYRPRYKYHGKLSPHHASPVHHWMLGSLLVVAAQLGVLANTAAEAQAIASEMQEELEENI